tara:strand:- start:958 stop:2346 length:1389 start_codon:yes stop_codon:yes gene_type:complete
MAKYIADQSLIRGAGKIAQSLRPMDLSGLDPVIEKGQKMMDIAIAEKKAVEKAFEAATNGVIMTAGALGDEFYNYTTDKVNGWKDMYYEGVRIGGTEGEKMKMDAMMQMQNWNTFVQNHKQWNIDYAETKKEDMLSSYMSIDDKHDITQILDKKYTLGENADGEMVFNITGRDGVQKQLTHAQYEDLMVIKNYTVDKTYTDTLNNSYKTRTFDRESTQWQILQSLPTDTKQFGAAMADGIQGQSLGSMLTKSRNDGTLSQELIAAIDTDGEAGISDEELDLFIDVITNTKNPMFDLETSRQIFAERLTNSIQRKHTEAWDENDRVKRIGKYKQEQGRVINLPWEEGLPDPNKATQTERAQYNAVASVINGQNIITVGHDVFTLKGDNKYHLTSSTRKGGESPYEGMSYTKTEFVQRFGGAYGKVPNDYNWGDKGLMETGGFEGYKPYTGPSGNTGTAADFNF